MAAQNLYEQFQSFCESEDISYSDSGLMILAECVDGYESGIDIIRDMRDSDPKVTSEHVSTTERDKEEDIFPFLDLLLKNGSPSEAADRSFDVDMTPDDMIWWIDENVPREYEDDELVDAYQHLSKADVWLGRTWRTQNYKLWRYAADEMTAGVAASRNGTHGGWTRYGAPSHWSKLGSTKSTRRTRDTIARKIGDHIGTSVGIVRRNVLPYLRRMLAENDRKFVTDVAARYDLSPDELQFLTDLDDGDASDIVDDAQDKISKSGTEYLTSALDATTPMEESMEVDEKEEEEHDDSEEQQGMAEFV